MPLEKETRFSRYYHSAERKTGYAVSRFEDGSASITAKELPHEWSSWSEDERVDFCQACYWLEGESDFAEMLRFIMQQAGSHTRSAVASSVASHLPRDEAFHLLTQALRSTEIGHCSNITQGIAKTEHPEADATLRSHLRTVWAHPGLWANADFINWVAEDATTCISHLTRMGASPADFVEQVRLLSTHVCSRNRDSCRNYLSKHYPWLQ